MLLGGFISSLLLIAAFVMSLRARNRINKLATRLDYMERAIDGLRDDLTNRRAPLGGRSEPTPSSASETEAQPTPRTSPAPKEPELQEQPATPGKPEPVQTSPSRPQPLPVPVGPAASVPAVTGGQKSAAGSGAETPQPPTRGSFEEVVGTRWAVWAGGAALALGGLFLVRYSIEAGLIGPGVRIFLGALLAATLIGGAEWMRRHDFKWTLPTDAIPPAHIPSVLTAAGTIVAFGTIYAAHALYGFIGPAAAFVLLGATGILTMLASALHGPALAGLGLVGAFAAPALVSSDSPSFWPLAIYFAVVAAAAYVLSRTRGWLWLAVCTLVGAAAWGLGMMLGLAFGATSDDPNTTATMAHVLAQSALVAFFFAYEPHVGQRDREAKTDLAALGALAVVTVLIVAYLTVVPFSSWQWSPTLILAIAILTFTGWLSPPAAVAVALAGLTALVALSMWPGLYMPPDRTLLAPYAARLLRLPDNVSNYLAASAWWTLLPAGIAGYRIWRGPLLPVPTTAIYAAAATLSPLLALILAYLRVTQFDTSIAFALGGTSLAAVYAVIASQFDKADRDNSVPAYHFAAGAFAAAAIGALGFAMAASLSRGYLTVALALTALGTAYVASLRGLPLLRHVVTALGAIIAARLAWDPHIMGREGVGATPLFNWLLLGYGVPALAFWQSARLLERSSEQTTAVRICDSLAVSFTALLAFFEIRHFLNDGDILQPAVGHVEAGLTALVAMLMSLGLARMNFAKRNPVFDIASMVLGAVAIAIAMFGLLVGANPYFTGDEIGGRTIISTLLPAYLLPGLCALYVARHARNFRPLWYTRAAGVLAVGLIFLYVTLETRHAFHGSRIAQWLNTSDPESWAMSVAWLMLGIVLLAYGLWRSSLEARIASAVLVTLAALKVTLYDLAGIGGLWRALSFICLGAVLIGIGLVYQRLIFNKPEESSQS
ncbi:MAG: DUF2339 domain-containing protein [Hyphomicrobiaceae bacterium]